MKRVVLINPPQNTRYPQPPMGLALLGAILESKGYQVNILDGNILPVVNLASQVDVDMVGLTAMTPTINSALNIARKLKQMKSHRKIIIGGVHASLLPQDIVKNCPEIDAVVVGEGEQIITDLLLNGINGICQSTSLSDMDSLPFLAYHLLPFQSYKPHPPHGRAMPFMTMLTSRGCPYSCSYCSKGVFGNNFRAQSPGRVVDEIFYYIKKFGAKEIAFYDDVFTLDKKRVYGISEQILERNLKINWSCETRANLVDKDLLRVMKKSGCYTISYGIESGSQEILNIIDKNITLEQSEMAIRLTREAGIQTIGYFMIGSPNETPDTIKQTINLARKLKLDYAQFAITTPFPMTKLWEYYKAQGRDVPSWDSLSYMNLGHKTSPIFDSTELNREDIEHWVSRAYRDFYLRFSYIFQRLSKIRSAGDVRVLINGLDMLRGM